MNSNIERIARATTAVSAYDEAWGEHTGSLEELLIDLIADVGHLARSENVDFARVLRCAQTHLSEE
jgi:hypothetical protein